MVSISRHAWGTQSAVPSSVVASSIGNQGAETARVSGAPGLAARPTRLSVATVQHRAPAHAQHSGRLVGQYLQFGLLALGRRDPVEKLQLAVGLQQAGMRTDAIHPDTGQPLGRRYQNVRHRAQRQFHDQVVYRVTRAAFHHVERQDVAAGRTEREGQRPQAARAVEELDAQQIRRHGPTVAQPCIRGISP